ncbi:MAG: hypothetical protein MPJ50_04995 [Pirellulales bacterium]|nr:hypothetical protein [Pirellulales bacterium]
MPPPQTPRVDQAHATRPNHDRIQASTTADGSIVSQQLKQQALDLEQHLQNRQRELDHRESQLNARLAEFERESRATRLALLERERQLAAEQTAFARSEGVKPDGSSKETKAAGTSQQNNHDSQLKRELLLDQREQSVTEREREIRRLRDELFAAREETLEIRLATEELWRQLCDALPPDAVNRSVGRIRERLAEHYRLVREDLNDYRGQLETLRCDLDEKLEHWSRRKGELASWAQQRMLEVDNYHNAVSERAAAIDQRQSELTLLQTAWRQDRQELESRIQRLQKRLDQAAGANTSAVPAPHRTASQDRAAVRNS